MTECPSFALAPTPFLWGERPDERAVRSRVPSGGEPGVSYRGVSSRASGSPHSRRKGSIGREFYRLRSLARALLERHPASGHLIRERKDRDAMPPSTLSVAGGRHSGTSLGSERQSTDGGLDTCAAVDIVQENR